MTEITIRIPTRLERYLERKVQEGYDSAENFMLSLVESCELQDSRAMDIMETLDSPQLTALEDLLDQRLEGPFVPLADDWKDRVLEKAHARIAAV